MPEDDDPRDNEGDRDRLKTSGSDVKKSDSDKKDEGPRLGRFLKHPLVIAVLAGIFTAVLIPHVTRGWQDRQREAEIKQSLLDDISSSSTTAVRQAISLAQQNIRAAGGERGESAGDTYAVLRNSWLTKRASARSRIIVYFPDLYGCWYSYERAVADYLSLSVLNSPASKQPKSAATAEQRSAAAKNAKVRVKLIKQYVDGDFATTYVAPYMPDGCKPISSLPQVVQARLGQLQKATNWNSLALPTDDTRFRQAYAILGETMLIGMERIIETITHTDANGFSHFVV
jgi:hypothetical protein